MLGSVRRSFPAIAVACSSLVLIAGCGSSESSSGSPAAAGAPSTSSASNGTSSSGTTTTGGSAPGKTHTATSPGLQTDTTPKFASPSSSAPVQSGIVNIAYRNIAIAPDTVRVKVGSTIKWTNYDPIPHNVTSEGGVAQFKSNNFGEGGSFEVTVTKPGIIHYENTLQPTTMNGTIEVVG
jgi:plastocyanin